MTQPSARAPGTASIWMDLVPPGGDREGGSELEPETESDVCVVGAGMAGLSTAYHLASEGVRVLVLDQRRVGGGESGRTTAHLASALDDRYHHLEKLHGHEGARLAAESHAAAIQSIGDIARVEGIDCDFARVDGFLFAGPGRPVDELDAELEAAERAGLSVERMGESCWPWFDTGPCLRFRNQAEIHPLRYLVGLAGAIRRLGGRIATGVHATRLEGGKRCRVITAGGQVVHAGSLVVATNSPVHGVVGIHGKQAAYRSYVIALELPAGRVEHALYWDTLDPYHYVRVARSARPDLEWLVVGGEDHRTGQEDDGEARFDRLTAWARERFPMAGRVALRWSGQILEPADGLAFIGRSPGLNPNVYLVTGDSGNGMTHGALAGLLLTDLVLGRANPWAELYDPARVRLRALGEMTRENLNVAAQYADWLTPGQSASAIQLAPGSGRVVRRGLKKVALYRDPDGALHELSATCTHMGGVVSWNSAEGSWDCPCHGSRFDAYGRVLNGPARRDLGGVSAATSSAKSKAGAEAEARAPSGTGSPGPAPARPGPSRTSPRP
jgi:glycine/D-amino acid oxidase-like deaminating enzyme/nitrite reductase/ring-hydroxylating ferredoxin subunit